MGPLGNWDLWVIGTLGQLGPLGNWEIRTFWQLGQNSKNYKISRNYSDKRCYIWYQWIVPDVKMIYYLLTIVQNVVKIQCFDEINKKSYFESFSNVKTVKKILIWKKVTCNLKSLLLNCYIVHQNQKPCIFKAFGQKQCISKKKPMHLQGFLPKTVYLKCFGIQLKTVYLQGPHSLRPCISRPCCIIMKLFHFSDFFLGNFWLT